MRGRCHGDDAVMSGLERLEETGRAGGAGVVATAALVPLKYRTGMGYPLGYSLSTASLQRERSLCMRVPPQRIHHEVRLRNLWGGYRVLSSSAERRVQRSPPSSLQREMKTLWSSGGRRARSLIRELRSG